MLITSLSSFQENVGLKVLNLSWNGFSDSGAMVLGAALQTCTLVELDLSSNRVGRQLWTGFSDRVAMVLGTPRRKEHKDSGSDGFLELCAGLHNNNDLKILKVGGVSDKALLCFVTG